MTTNADAVFIEQNVQEIYQLNQEFETLCEKNIALYHHKIYMNNGRPGPPFPKEADVLEYETNWKCMVDLSTKVKSIFKFNTYGEVLSLIESTSLDMKQKHDLATIWFRVCFRRNREVGRPGCPVDCTTYEEAYESASKRFGTPKFQQ